MNATRKFLQDQKVRLLIDYDKALESNLTFLAKKTRLRLEYIDELLGEVSDD